MKMKFAERLETQLARHYGEDKYVLLSAKFKVAGLVCGILLGALIGFISYLVQLTSAEAFAILMGHATATIVTFSLALWAFLSGCERLTNHTVMTGSSLNILAGILLSGGIPVSPIAYMIAIPPAISYWLYGPRTGIIMTVAFVAVGVFQYLFFPIQGEPLLNFADLRNGGQAGYFLAWISGYVIFLCVIGLQQREAALLQAQLNEEKQKLGELAMTDALTGLKNGRYFHSELE